MTSLAKIRDIACDFRSGKSTVQDLIKPLIGKSDGRLNFDLMDKNTLLKEAQETQEKILLGDERLFLGIPSVVSDNIMINGFNDSREDAENLSKLLKNIKEKRGL